MYRKQQKREGIEILYKDTDPDKTNPTLALIGRSINNPKKLSKLEDMFEAEMQEPRKKVEVKIMTKVGSIPQGEGFGEIALTNRKPRSASIFASEDWVFAVLSKKDFDIIISDVVKKNRDSKTMVFKNIPAFAHLTKKTLEKLTFYMIETKMTKDSYLFREGDKIKGLYLVQEGEFEVSRKFKKTLDQKYNNQAFPVQVKRDVTFWVVGKNETLGLEYILDKSDTHSYSCKCISSSGIVNYVDKQVRN